VKQSANQVATAGWNRSETFMVLGLSEETPILRRRRNMSETHSKRKWGESTGNQLLHLLDRALLSAVA